MFGLFKSRSFSDPTLGEFHLRRRAWRGEISVGDARVPLVVPGSRAAPDAHAFDVARSLPADDPGWREAIEAALFEHYAPYAQAVAEGEIEPPGRGLPRISQPDGVWPHTTVAFVAVIPIEGGLGVEIGYEVAWDEEHTLGARLLSGRLIELNGSVLRP